jgi:phosphatidylinositol-3-phosphatase
VFLLVLENHSYAQIVGNPNAPFLNATAKRYGLAANYFAITHPSEPNYIALAAGTTRGVTSDDVTSLQGRTLADQVTWRSYMQSYSGPLYALKHDPFGVFGHNSEDWSRFATDSLRQFTLIVPDLCHDMHGADECSDDASLVRAGDTFVGSAVSAIRKRWTPGSLIFITFDEGSDTDNHVLTIVMRYGSSKHVVSHQRYNHYSLLRTIEDHFGVRCLGSACGASPMRSLAAAGSR